MGYDKSDILKKRMLEALEKCKCVVSDAAKAANVCRQTHYKWMDSDPKYKTAVLELDNTVIDFVENKLFKLIEDGEPSAIYFFLKTRGRKRGYSERENESSPPIQSPVQIVINHTPKLPTNEEGIE